MQNNFTIKIPNFKLNVFRQLLDQSLIVDNQLMLEFSNEFIKSVTFSSSQTFMKMWVVPLKNLIMDKNEENELFPELIAKSQAQTIPTFNFYVLKGDLFKKYLSVNTSDIVDLEFTIHEINNKFYAANIIVSGKINDNQSLLTTNFTLTTEELISNKIEDYSAILDVCKPTEAMTKFVLTNLQIQEVKRLIKNLHKSSPNNTSYLTIILDGKSQKIVVNDSVFNITFPLTENIGDVELKFNILKSDFMMAGNHTFSIMFAENEEKVIFGGNFASSIIWCLMASINEKQTNDIDNSSALDTVINNDTLTEYL